MRIPQVAQTVEPHARGKPAVKFCFRGRIRPRTGGRDAARQCGILERCNVLRHMESITTLCKDV